jgi:hypothetical protein
MILIFFRNIAFFKCFAYQWPALDKEQRGGSEARDSHTVFWNLKACCPSRSVLSTRSSIFSPRSRTRSVKYEEERRQGEGRRPMLSTITFFTFSICPCTLETLSAGGLLL